MDKTQKIRLIFVVVMEFGKLQNIEHVDFSLPKDAAGTTLFLSHLEPKVNKNEIFIGCTGWNMKQWVGNIYPPKTKTADYLEQYAKQFNTIELNATHYKIPNVETIARWKDATPEHFKFCPKVPQMLSHSRDLGVSHAALSDFVNIVLSLKERLGCCFLQLPPYFDPSRLDYLERFLAALPFDFPMAVEVRNAKWFDDESHFERLFRLLEKYNCSSVMTDVAGRRDVLHQRLTTTTAMIRFVGNGLHTTDFSRIDAWIEKINIWQNSGIEKLYFFCHEPDNLLSPQLADYFITKMRAANPNLSLKNLQFHNTPSTPNDQLYLF